MMALLEYFKTLDDSQRAELAAKLGTTYGHLRNMAYGCSPISPLNAAQLELHSGGKVPRWASRPNDWHLIWPPELGDVNRPPSSFNDTLPLSRESVGAQPPKLGGNPSQDRHFHAEGAAT